RQARFRARFERQARRVPNLAAGLTWRSRRHDVPPSRRRPDDCTPRPHWQTDADRTRRNSHPRSLGIEARVMARLSRPHALAWLAACHIVSSAAAAERPNVVIVLADDQGWGDLSIHGNTNLRTPNIDSLGRDGALFDRFYVCPVCSPTRAELLTGRYHPRGG